MKKRILCVLLVSGAVGCTHVAPDGRFQRWALGRAAWSLGVPGVGQIMNGQPGKGALMLGLVALNAATGGEWVEDAEGRRRWEWDSEEAREFSAVAGLALSTWSGIDAYRAAKKQNETAPIRLGAGPAEAGSPSARRDAGTLPVLVLDPFGGGLSATLCRRF